jgi:hypothetical protein
MEQKDEFKPDLAADRTGWYRKTDPRFLELQKSGSQVYHPGHNRRASQLLLPDHSALAFLRRPLGQHKFSSLFPACSNLSLLRGLVCFESLARGLYNAGRAA